ncbi:hypothetical protein G6F37_000964 [Rhizopus arrhizus]|nr:hypothetical protein G6F38_000690 [Rhizopus arrhizus]KAG1163708.1 hypothetical protein G6F37_000964 [Rhizopus arrhizus]
MLARKRFTLFFIAFLMLIVVVNAASPNRKKHRYDEDEEDYEDDDNEESKEETPEEGKPADQSGDLDYTTPKKEQWLEDVDLSSIVGQVRPVGSGTCHDAKCDGTDNDKCFETCGNTASAEDIYGCPDERTWSLTFDDGPSEFTHELLDILDDLNVKATFCVMGAHVKKYPEIVKRAYDAGHQIASHTYSHPHLMSLTNEDIVYEVRATEEEIENAIGIKPKYIRPPYGEADDRVKSILKQLGYKVLMWNVDPTDYDVYTMKDGSDRIQKVFDQVIHEKDSNLNVHEDHGFISLQHDLYQVSIHQVPKIVRALQHANYTMNTAASCIGDEEPHMRLAVNPRIAESVLGISMQAVETGKKVESQASDKQSAQKKQKSNAVDVKAINYSAVLVALIVFTYNLI